ncbi:efflux transporter outer membrane subunit [Roseateles cavernae]|uniref:efflux transporter outer membrane subunit n=1 Tax=Roseateles cavernae TaxID=3153578 RepID=UPI0032E48C23
MNSSLLHRPRRAGLAPLCLLVIALGGCAVVPAPRAELPAPPAWQAGLPALLPHQGSPEQLRQWWARFDDPLLAELITQAQGANPGLQQALARIGQARAAAGLSASAGAPQLGLAGSAGRSRSAVPSNEPARGQASLGLDASWEIDLFARVRQQAQAAGERAAASELDWHQARVSLAAEVARQYLSLRSCEQLLAIGEREAESLGQLALLARDKARVGFEAPAAADLLEGAAAEAHSRRLAQRADCDLAVKGLVALTALDEAALRQRLGAATARLPAPALFALPRLPAELLAQRPDLAASERLVLAAWAERGAAEAERYPQLRLSGSLNIGALRVAGSRDDGNGWSLGPSLSLPLLDGGARRAQVDAAQGRYEEALAAHRGALLQAVREVEEALVRLDAAQARESHVAASVSAYERSLAGTQQRWRQGLASAAELEDARRLALNAQASLVQVQEQRVAAWVALYKASGGGWQQGSSS